MFGGIAVKKKINACETSQISVSLRVGELVSLGKSPDTCDNIFDSVKYPFFVHIYLLLLAFLNKV